MKIHLKKQGSNAHATRNISVLMLKIWLQQKRKGNFNVTLMLSRNNQFSITT
jgi:hypothetical protein